MRLHIYDYNPFLGSYDITLDGTAISKVIFADEEAGLIERYQTDDQGRVIIDPDDPTECLRERRFGEVVITLTNSQRAHLEHAQRERDTAHREGEAYQYIRVLYNDMVRQQQVSP